MSEFPTGSPLRKYVRVAEKKHEKELEELGLEWMAPREKNRLDYEIDWLGRPLIQCPEEIVLLQELVYNIRPDVVVEIGIAHGGGLIFYASILELLGSGSVIVFSGGVRGDRNEPPTLNQQL